MTEWPFRWRSLRVRVALLTACVACAAVAAVGWYSERVGQRLLGRQLAPLTPAELAATARSLEAAARRGSGAVQAVLAAASARTGKNLILTGRDGRVIAAAPAALAERGITRGADGTLTWAQPVAASPSAPGAPRLIRRERLLANLPVAHVRTPSGDTLGVLQEMPEAARLLALDELPAAGALRRSLGIGVAVALAGAVAVALLLSAHVVRPIERLTAAVRSAGAAPVPIPVPVRGSAEVVALGRSFDALMRELDRQERLRRRLTSDIAHELRTPLTNVRCHIESLQDGVERATPETLASLHEEVLVLQHLIEDLHDLALADAGDFRLAREPVELGAELERALRPFRARAAAAGVSVAAASPAPPALVDADPVRLRQILTNLVANAVDHTPPGGRVQLTAERRGAEVRVRVADTGTGIAPEHLPNVFERFYRADPARARARGGAGLGLAIVERLVTLHGGRIAIRSAPGEGTVVEFTLPTREA